MTTPYSTLITGVNRPDLVAKFGIAICLTNICLNYLFIPKDGLFSHIEIGGISFGISGTTGAALATVISFLIPFLGSRIMAKKLIGIKILQSHTPRHAVAGFIMGFVLYLLAYKTSLFPIIRWYTLLGFAGIGLMIYIAVLFVLKEFKKQDFHFFLNILHPKDMLSYVKSELKDEGKNKK